MIEFCSYFLLLIFPFRLCVTHRFLFCLHVLNANNAAMVKLHSYDVQRWWTRRLVTWHLVLTWLTALNRKELRLCSSASRNARLLVSEFQPRYVYCKRYVLNMPLGNVRTCKYTGSKNDVSFCHTFIKHALIVNNFQWHTLAQFIKSIPLHLNYNCRNVARLTCELSTELQ